MSLSINARNKENLPYNLQSDLIKVKIVIFEDFNHSYLDGIPVQVYANFDAPELLLGTYNTNEFGVIEFTYNTDNIIDKSINTGQLWCKFSYNGNNYISNKTRCNFIYDTSVVITILILDANDVITRATNPSGYINVDANTTALRLSNPDDYTIFTREFF